MATSIPLSLSLYVWQVEVLPILAGRGIRVGANPKKVVVFQENATEMAKFRMITD
jgi:hypothetical protein